eukprot:COSAG02_NODE_22926_length_735_cov_2.454403_1_plen_74_part_00
MKNSLPLYNSKCRQTHCGHFRLRFLESIEISLRNVVKFPHVCRESGMDIWAAILQCTEQLLLRQRPKNRDHGI